jgi:hypothetical protein
LQKWEFLRIDQFRDRDLETIYKSLEPPIDLVALGNAAWELVSGVPAPSYLREYAGTTSGLLWIFKRPVEKDLAMALLKRAIIVKLGKEFWNPVEKKPILKIIDNSSLMDKI